MAEFLLCFIVVLSLLSAEGTTEKLFCEGEEGNITFPVVDGAQSLDVKNHTNGTMLNWSRDKGDCIAVSPHNSRLKLFCNKTHIAFTLMQMTHNDTGYIKMLKTGERNVSEVVAITVAGTVFLNESCSIQGRMLVCGNIEHLHNRTVQVQDANGKLLHWFRNSGVGITFLGTEYGTFSIVLDAKPTCFHPLTFTLDAEKPSKLLQCTGELPAWCIGTAVFCILFGCIILLMLYIYNKFYRKRGSIGPSPNPKEQSIWYAGSVQRSNQDMSPEIQIISEPRILDERANACSKSLPPPQAFENKCPPPDEELVMSEREGPQTRSKTIAQQSHPVRTNAPKLRLRFPTLPTQAIKSTS